MMSDNDMDGKKSGDSANDMYRKFIKSFDPIEEEDRGGGGDQHGEEEMKGNNNNKRRKKQQSIASRLKMSFVKGATLVPGSGLLMEKNENLKETAQHGGGGDDGGGDDEGVVVETHRRIGTGRSIGSDAKQPVVKRPKLSMNALFNSDDDDSEEDEEEDAEDSKSGANETASASGRGGGDNSGNMVTRTSTIGQFHGRRHALPGQSMRNIDLFLQEIKETEKTMQRQSANAATYGDSDNQMALPHSDVYHDDDPQSTNLYIGNISPNVTEPVLENEFGKYGPIASVKIMWPRKEEEKLRNRNSGFVNFMKKKDAARAMAALDGLVIDGYQMRVGWGKRMPLPSDPIFEPPLHRNIGQFGYPEIHVRVPTDRHVRRIIYRIAYFVAHSTDGFQFERRIMDKEHNNAKMRFLFDTRSPDHIFYKWKVYSLLQGDTLREWRTAPFQMFAKGMFWFPPPCPIPEISAQDEDDLAEFERQVSIQQQALQLQVQSRSEGGCGSAPVVIADGTAVLSNDRRSQFGKLLRELTIERESVSRAMFFCLDNAESAKQIVDAIVESLSVPDMPMPHKIAHLYLISDILHNTTPGQFVTLHTPPFLTNFEKHMSTVFTHLNQTYRSPLLGRLTAAQMKDRVEKVLEAWVKHELFPEEYIELWRAIFLGYSRSSSESERGPLNQS